MSHLFLFDIDLTLIRTFGVGRTAMNEVMHDLYGMQHALDGVDFGGRTDLYRVTWPGNRPRLERLTNDDYDDLEPDVSPDGQWVAFASDRGTDGYDYALFRLSLLTGAIETVSHPDSGDDRQPVYSPDGRWIAFRSTRGGTSDLYVRPAEPSYEARRLTRLAGPAMDPDWLAGSRALLFTAQQAITSVREDIRPLISNASAIAEEASRTAALATAQVHKVDRLVHESRQQRTAHAARIDERVDLRARRFRPDRKDRQYQCEQRKGAGNRVMAPLACRAPI